jgi:hypothetical protein
MQSQHTALLSALTTNNQTLVDAINALDTKIVDGFDNIHQLISNSTNMILVDLYVKLREILNKLPGPNPKLYSTSSAKALRVYDEVSYVQLASIETLLKDFVTKITALMEPLHLMSGTVKNWDSEQETPANELLERMLHWCNNTKWTGRYENFLITNTVCRDRWGNGFDDTYMFVTDVPNPPTHVIEIEDDSPSHSLQEQPHSSKQLP